MCPVWLNNLLKPIIILTIINAKNELDVLNFLCPNVLYLNKMDVEKIIFLSLKSDLDSDSCRDPADALFPQNIRLQTLLATLKALRNEKCNDSS